MTKSKSKPVTRTAVQNDIETSLAGHLKSLTSKVGEVSAKLEKEIAKSVEKFSNVGFQFGRFLSQDANLKNVPIGLIDSSFGGTSISVTVTGAV